MKPLTAAFALVTLFLTVSACKKGDPSFAGSYRTTWGSAVLTQEGSMVIGTYPRGNLRCRAEHPRLSCDWLEGTARGKAKLARDPVTLTLRGSWGHGDSDESGGPWVFAPIPK